MNLNPLSFLPNMANAVSGVIGAINRKRDLKAEGSKTKALADAHAVKVAANNTAAQLAIDKTIHGQLDKSWKDEFVTFIIYSPMIVAVVGAFVVLILSVFSVFSGQMSMSEFTQQTVLLQQMITSSIAALPPEFFELMIWVTLAAIGMTGALKGAKFKQSAANQHTQLISKSIIEVNETRQKSEKEASSLNNLTSAVHPVTAAALQPLKIREGEVLGLYADSENLLTMGIGTLVSTTPVTVEVEKWLKEAKFTFSQEEIESLAIIRIDQKRTELNHFGWFRELDDKRKSLVVRMCFWLGTHGFINEWPNTIKAIKQQNWKAVHDALLDSKIGRGEQGEGVKRRMGFIADEFINPECGGYG